MRCVCARKRTIISIWSGYSRFHAQNIVVLVGRLLLCSTIDWSFATASLSLATSFLFFIVLRSCNCLFRGCTEFVLQEPDVEDGLLLEGAMRVCNLIFSYV